MLKELLIKQYGSLANQIINGLSKEKYTSFRVNTIKATNKEIEQYLINHNITFEKVSWYDDAFVITDKTDIKQLSIYDEGKIYLQSLSSMIPPIVLNPKEKSSILDMCASPGSKTTQLACLTNNNALITAIEKNKIRCERLKYNLEKQGIKRVTVLNEDSRNLDDYFSFDYILLDAPCTGSGTRKSDLGNLNKIVKIQEQLLEKAFKLLKKDGTLIYSTCSLLKEENEEQIIRFINKFNCKLESINIDVPHIDTVDNCLCIMPSQIYEGFFIAKIRK